MALPFELHFEGVQRLEAWLLEFPYPAEVHVVDRNGVEVVQLLSSLPLDGDEIRVFEQPEMLCHRLSRHVEARAQLGQRLAAAFVQTVKQHPAVGVGQGFEHFVNLLHGGTLTGRHYDRQVKTCMSRHRHLPIPYGLEQSSGRDKGSGFLCFVMSKS
jgi:hypothetical protein